MTNIFFITSRRKNKIAHQNETETISPGIRHQPLSLNQLITQGDVEHMAIDLLNDTAAILNYGMSRGQASNHLAMKNYEN